MSERGRSVKELLANSKVARVAHQVATDIRANAEVLNRTVATTANAPSREKTFVTCQVPLDGKKSIAEVQRAWNVSEAAILRLAVREMLVKYGFKAESILLDVDEKAINRHASVRRPYITLEEAHERRRKNLVSSDGSFGRANPGGDDPS